MTIKEIYEFLEGADCTTKNGLPLNESKAFLRLKDLSKLKYQPKFALDEKVIYNGKHYFVSGISIVNRKITYRLPLYGEYNPDNWCAEDKISTPEEFLQKNLDEAVFLLENNGFKVSKE